MRSWYEKPQSSSSHRLKELSATAVASGSAQALLDAAAERRKHQRGGEPLLVEDPQARLPVLVLRAQWLDLQQRRRIDTVRHLAAE